MLSEMWEKKILKLQMEATNKEAKLFVSKIFKVSWDTRRKILDKYVESCMLVHRVAFNQWRIMYKNKTDGMHQAIMKVLDPCYQSEAHDCSVNLKEFIASTQAQNVEIDEIIKFRIKN